MTHGLRASVLVPTHDHPSTLPLTVRSVLRQELADLEVIVIGDGVTPQTRAAALALVDEDDRVRFLDLPKGPHHGEVHRHTAVLASRSEAILYLCDDDLLLPGHVGDLVELLAGAGLAQSRNGFVTPEGEIMLYPADLARDETIRWMLDGPRYNQVSLTGTGHTRSAYLALGDPWETTPEGEWPDHYMWKKFFRMPGFRGARSSRMTALQFPTSGGNRVTWSSAARRAELEPWAALVAEDGSQDRVDRLVEAVARRELDRMAVLVSMQSDLILSAESARETTLEQNRVLHEQNRVLHEQNQRMHDESERRARRIAHLVRRVRRLRTALDRLESSRTWRLRRRVKAILARLTR